MNTEFKNSKNTIQECYILYPENYARESYYLALEISKKCKIKCSSILYKLDLTADCINKIIGKLETNAIFIIGYEGKMSHANYYKLGLINSHKRHLIIMNLTNNESLPQYLKPSFYIGYASLSKKEKFNQILNLLQNVVLCIISEDLPFLFYQMAINLCKNRKEKCGDQIVIISRAEFTQKISRENLSELLELYTYGKIEELTVYIMSLVICNSDDLSMVFEEPLDEDKQKVLADRTSKTKESSTMNVINITNQNHTGLGDNIGRDKNVNSSTVVNSDIAQIIEQNQGQVKG